MVTKQTNSEYDEYYRTKLASALEFQDHVVDICSQRIGLIIQQYSSHRRQLDTGESRNGVEVKHDEMFADTGNLWIECFEKSHPDIQDYTASGIFRDDNSWLYAIGNYDVLFIFSKKLLQGLDGSGRYPRRENKTKTSVGYLLPSYSAYKYAANVITT